MKRATFILALIAALAACREVVAVTPTDQLPAMQPALEDRLFMGRSITGGGTVTDQQWKQFLDEVVTPRFPDGLTVYRTDGQWRESDGSVTSEQSFVLEVIHGGGAAATRALEEIAAEYKRRFRQSAVLHTRSTIQMTIL